MGLRSDTGGGARPCWGADQVELLRQPGAQVELWQGLPESFGLMSGDDDDAD